MDERGPKAVDEKVLDEYWLQYVMPNWNEYGVGKSNMWEGFIPPLAGELYNTRWKHSNGAWSCTEIGVCLYPGLPKTMLTAINCGDDTDCTGGTIGGTAGIPQDWVEYMGDDINIIV
ncbi:MAG: hypothetical protein IKA09_07105 [Lachnospiraceae bacterium]|nr:hypothetical protein [Lachnospiraceae bacterium]